MDFMSDKEFHPIFERTTRVVDLKGAGTPAEINERLHQKIGEVKSSLKKGRMKIPQARRWISRLRQLIFAGFGRRTIDEAIAKPRGVVALTLRYGRKKANEILLKRGRKRIGSLRMLRRRKRIFKKRR
jgi:hypothetical protein